MKRRARDSIPHSETNLFYSVPILVSNVGLIWIKLVYIKTMGFLKDICNARNYVQARHKSVRLPKTTKKLHDAFYMKTKNVGADRSLLMLILTVHLPYFCYIYIFPKMFLLIWCNTLYAAVLYIIHWPVNEIIKYKSNEAQLSLHIFTNSQELRLLEHINVWERRKFHTSHLYRQALMMYIVPV